MLLPAEERHHAAHIVEDTEAVLPCRGFGIVASGLVGVETFAPVSVGTASAEESRATVETTGVVRRTLAVFRSNRRFAHPFCHGRDAPVVVGVFEQARHTFTFAVGGDVAITDIVVAAFFIDVGRTYHGIEGALCRCGITGRRPYAFKVGIGNDAGAVVADHAFGLSGA